MIVLAHRADFETIQPGDRIPSFQKAETQQDIDNYMQLNRLLYRERAATNSHHDPATAKEDLFGSTVNYGVTTCGFFMELLEKAFPLRSIQLGKLSMRAAEPIRPGDVVTYSGVVIGKGNNEGEHVVDVDMQGVNQLGQTVATAHAVVVLP